VGGGHERGKVYQGFIIIGNYVYIDIANNHIGKIGVPCTYNTGFIITLDYKLKSNVIHYNVLYYINTMHSSIVHKYLVHCNVNA